MRFFSWSLKAVTSRIRAARQRRLVADIYFTAFRKRFGRALTSWETDWTTALVGDTLWLLGQPSADQATLRIGLYPWSMPLSGLSTDAAQSVLNDLNNQLKHQLGLTHPALYLVHQTISGHTLH